MKSLVRQIAGIALLVAMLVLVTGAALVVTVSALSPRDGAPVVVIAAPWSTGAGGMVDAAGGRRLTPWPPHRLAALAVFDGTVPADSLRRKGAWALVDGGQLARFCGVS
ncbi:hypothetical protein [Sagittula sp. MA-2]|jgi:hypothetical protein|uniref:hypothetical protein n=1 Tax=Sagittula sp. MA-2 TaxID=3048007 RepID=UPI0024C33A11|nr:hypothetical protein [Sagittula sp. MA-2]WHZ37277.1 hypothetical protein QNI11_09695 [Sagittula sp. MA-2]